MRNGYFVFCLAAAIAAIGCGSKDDQGSTSGASEMRASAASSSNTDDTPKERGDVGAGECIVETIGTFAVRPGAYSQKCIECICNEGPKAVALCDDQANMCWSLISCVGKNCQGTEGIDNANCAVEMCGEFIGGSGLAMAVGVLLQGETCSADCPMPSS